MKLVARLGILALVAAPLGAIAAFGDNSPQVEMATPGVGNGAIERFTARFNTAMVPLGDPRAASPFAVECPVGGEGRWVDQQTFVYEFSTPLPGGVTCKFKRREKLKSLSGYDVIFGEGNPSFNAAALAAYVMNGGNVMYMGGTGIGGSAAVEAGYSNPFLNMFGLAFASDYNGLGTVNTTG